MSSTTAGESERLLANIQDNYNYTLDRDENQFETTILPGPAHRRTGTTISVAFSQLTAITLVVIAVVLTMTLIVKPDQAADVDVECYFTFLYAAATVAIVVVKLALRQDTDPVIKQSGSTYVKFGAALFGICYLLWLGFQFCAALEKNSSDQALSASVPFMHVVFILAQLAFVCAYSNVCINKWKTIGRLSVTFIWATNVSGYCRHFAGEIWSDRYTQEQESRERESLCGRLNDSFTDLDYPTDDTPTDNHVHFTDVLVLAGKFLMPAAMEYDIIMAGIVYYLYSNIGTEHVALRAARQAKNRSLQNSVVGFTAGIAALVISILAAVGYTVIFDDHYTAEFVYYGFISLLNLLTLFACVAGLVMMYRSDWLYSEEARKERRLEISLLTLSLVGQIIQPIFAILAAANFLHSGHNAVVLIVKECSRITSVFVQFIFLYDALHRSPPRHASKATQTRQLAMFLIFSNITLWWLSIYEIKAISIHPIQSCFFGIATWALILHLATPLEIYFRFHSAILLLEIWESFYQ